MAIERYLRFGKEDTFGEGTTTAFNNAIRILDESIHVVKDYHFHENISAINATGASLTTSHVEGDYTFEVKNNDMGPLLYSLCDWYAGTGTPAGPPAVHVYRDGTAAASITSQPLVFDIYRPTTGEAIYAGMKHSALELTAEAGAPLVAKASVIGEAEDSYASAGSTVTYDEQGYVLMNAGTFTLGAFGGGTASTTIRALTLKFDRGYSAEDWHRLGSQYPNEFKPYALTVEGDITFTAPNTDIYDAFKGGTSAAILLAFDSTSGDGGTTMDFNISLPRVYWTEADPGNMNKRERDEQNVSFRATVHPGSGFSYYIELDTSTDTAYSA